MPRLAAFIAFSVSVQATSPLLSFPRIPITHTAYRHLANRRLQETTATTTSIVSCSEDPFLWLIRQADNEIAGFAVGTMHVPHELVATEMAWQSLVGAASDACTIYGEIDTTDPEKLMESLATCENESPGFLGDVPDPELQAAYQEIIIEIVNEYGPPSIPAETFAAQLAGSVPLDQLLILVQAWNTPPMRDSTFLPIFAGPGGSTDYTFMDDDLLRLGRPSAGLETDEESCANLAAIAITKEHLSGKGFETVYKPLLEAGLNATNLPLIDAYKCGDAEGVVQAVGADYQDPSPQEEEQLKLLLDDRNIIMAGRMVEIMKSSNDLPFFAVGLAHWIYGSNSLEILLEKEGYKLERVEGAYDPNLLPDASCSDTQQPMSPSNGTQSSSDTQSVDSSTAICHQNMNWIQHGVAAAAVVAVAFLNLL